MEVSKLHRIKNSPSRFAAYFRRNQLMLTVTATFILLLLLALWGFIASQERQRVEEQRREQAREEILELTKEIRKIGKENTRLANRNLFYKKCHIRLWTEWTQHPHPIEIKNLYKCVAEFEMGEEGNTTVENTPTLLPGEAVAPGVAQNNQPKDSQTPKQNEPNEPTEPDPPQTREVCTIKRTLFGIDIRVNCKQEPV